MRSVVIIKTGNSTFMKHYLIFFVFILCFAKLVYCQSPEIKTFNTKVYDSDEIEDFYGSLHGGCSLACAFGWHFESSSNLPPQGKKSYEPKNLSDGDLATAWVEGKSTYGVGEIITVHFHTTPDVRNVPLKGIDFVNGYSKNLKTWKLNSRIKKLKVFHNNNLKYFFELVDSMKPQGIYFIEAEKHILLSHGDVLRFQIMEVYKGDKYKDTALTELNLHGAH